MIFSFQEDNKSDNYAILHKGKILRWYESNHKDIIPFKSLKPKKLTKIGSGDYVETDKYNFKSDIKKLGDLDTYMGTDAIFAIGFENNGKLIFLLEMYVDGVNHVGPAVLPKFTYKFISKSDIANKHEGYYLNKVRYNLDLNSNQKAAKFLQEQYKIMKQKKVL